MEDGGCGADDVHCQVEVAHPHRQVPLSPVGLEAVGITWTASNKSQGTNHGVRVEGHHNASDAEVGDGQRDNEQVRDVLQRSLLSINFIIAIQTIIMIMLIIIALSICKTYS